ncbi:hypothetical protein OKJ48_41335 [Streptomyces kunmingensis]|uniref:Uncharacterized protein n=1 Tax=Streptomyces kunmingensis TaxID=68225 RepID=A0ABU6CPH3_9ACTN|nr:hypothetical protein [Streptomyces kunmingensis]MEB3966628.1 hypothetical protein [Streptomyces kunmingensis]
MNDEAPLVVADITSEARIRCAAIGQGAAEVVENLRAELEKSPTLGRQVHSAMGELKLYTTRLEGAASRPALTVTYVYDAPPPEPGLIRIALVSPARFAGGDSEF